MSRAVGRLIVGGLLAVASRAGAEPILRRLPSPLLVGAFGGGAGTYGRALEGFVLGADTGIATLVSSDTDTLVRGQTAVSPSHRGWAFGVRAAYVMPSGLAVQARFDDLGIHTSTGPTSVMFGSAGVRYSLPFVVAPFADALVGMAFDSSGASVGASVGLGASVLVTRHLGIDVAVRDWIADLGGEVRHVPTVTAGLQLGFGR